MALSNFNETVRIVKEAEIVSQLAHWAAISGHHHVVLGGFYEGLTGLTDRLVESYIVSGLAAPSFKSITFNVPDVSNIRAYIKSFGDTMIVAERTCEYPHTKNIFAEISELAYKTVYLLSQK